MFSWRKRLCGLCGCCVLLVGCAEDLADTAQLAAEGVANALQEEQEALEQQDKLEEETELKTIEQEELAIENGTLTEGQLEAEIETEEKEIEKCVTKRGLKKMTFSIANRKGARECSPRSKIILRMQLGKIRKHICSADNDVENGKVKPRQKLKKNYLRRLLKRVKRVKERRDKNKPNEPQTMPPPSPNMPSSQMPPDGSAPPKQSGPKRVAKICGLLNDLFHGKRRKYFESVEHQEMSVVGSDNSTQDPDQEQSEGDGSGTQVPVN